MKIEYAAANFLLATLAVSTNTVLAHEESATDRVIRMPLIKRKGLTASSLRKRDGYSNSLYNDNRSSYLINMAIGTPAQNFEVLIDTGSADLWVPGSQCPDTVCPFAKYNEQSSSTYKSLDKPFNITYGIGSASGVYCTETVTVAGVSVQQQQFGYVNATQNILTGLRTVTGESYTPTASSASNATSTSNDNTMDGILGLGYPFLTSSTSNSYNPFVFNLKEQGKISQNVFSIFLNSSESYDNSGEIIFGGVDSSKYNGNILYMPVSKSTRNTVLSTSISDYGYWEVYGQGFGVLNGVTKNIAITSDATTSFVFDTGTTLTYLPTDVVVDLLTAAVGSSNLAYDSANNYFSVSCSVAKQNTIIQFMMSTSSGVVQNPVVLNIPIADLIFPMDSDYVSTASTCMFGIVPTNGRILIGDSVLRSVYQVYDADQNRIGIAGAISSKATVSSLKSSVVSSSNGSTSTAGTLSNSATNSAAINFNFALSISTISIITYLLSFIIIH